MHRYFDFGIDASNLEGHYSEQYEDNKHQSLTFTLTFVGSIQ